MAPGKIHQPGLHTDRSTGGHDHFCPGGNERVERVIDSPGQVERFVTGVGAHGDGLLVDQFTHVFVDHANELGRVFL